MIRILGIASILLLFNIGLLAQTNYIQEGRDGIYQIYIGPAKIGTEEKVYSKLRKYGFLRPFSITQVSAGEPGENLPIYLGPYLGRETADHVLAMVQKMGYADAYVEGDEVSLTTNEGAQLTHTVQIGAYENLDASFYASLSNQPAKGVFILYEEGLYKFMGGLYPESSEAYLENYAVKYWNESLNINAFVRPFRNPYSGR
ncbi:MAG: hypothetical protein MRZ79_14910 [Bacteroidia bacterium]|nr:hypothetical protein [Bacteroidia bacterium]